MRIATYNLLHGEPVVGRESAARIGTAEGLAEAIALLSPDVVGLQEVDVGQPRSGHVHQPSVVAQAMDADHFRFVPVLHGTPGEIGSTTPTSLETIEAAVQHGELPEGRLYGIGLVSRYPVRRWHSTVFDPPRISLPLMVPSDNGPTMMKVPDEPRAVIAAEVETEHGLMTVATAHLSFVPGVNAKQLRNIRSWMAAMPRPSILFGDFNLPGGLPALFTGWTQLVKMPTYPSFGPRVQFDHVLADGLAADLVERARASAQVHVLPISDHCAVSVDLDIDD